jgi:hypothetical protein
MTHPSAHRTPTVNPPLSTAFPAYSTWNTRPSGEYVVVLRSYPEPIPLIARAARRPHRRRAAVSFKFDRAPARRPRSFVVARRERASSGTGARRARRRVRATRESRDASLVDARRVASRSAANPRQIAARAMRSTRWRVDARFATRGRGRARTRLNASAEPARTRAFDPTRAKDLKLLGAKENLLDAIERNDAQRIDAAIDECGALYDGERRSPATSRALRGRWRLVHSKQAANANPFQILFQGAAKNYQTFDEDDGVRNAVELGMLRIEAFATSENAGAVRTNIEIRTVDVSFGGRRLKTFELNPKPGAGRGWVEQRFLDEEVRISVGNKGSVFVHVKDDEGESAKEAKETTDAATTTTSALARVERRADEDED